MSSRKLKISGTFLAEMFRDGKEWQAVRVMEGLPAGAEVTEASFNYDDDVLEVWIAHESFTDDQGDLTVFLQSKEPQP